MITLAACVVLSGIMCYVCNRNVGEGDDFGAAFLALGFGVVAAALSLTYIGLAFWFHRFI